jgi:hypothetical protein
MENEKIAEIAKRIATVRLSAVCDTSSISTVDFQGRDAVRITIVLDPAALGSIKSKGDAVLDTLVEINQALRNEGEHRFPIVEYATQEELNESGDP